MKNNLLYEKSYQIKLDIDFSKIKQELIENDFVILKLPQFKDIQKTPENENAVFHENLKPIYLALIHVLQKLDIFPVVFKGENDGKIIRNVCPMIQNKSEESFQGAEQELRYHIYGSHLHNTPDTFSLFCIRNNETISTDLVKVEDLMNKLEREDLQLLSENKFIFTSPVSFGENIIETKDKPIFFKENGKDFIKFSAISTKSDSKPHQNAVNKLKALLENTKKYHIQLDAGDFLIFNNKRVLHSRKSFKPKFDGNDRWLLRILGLNYLPPIEALVDAKTDNHHLNF